MSARIKAFLTHLSVSVAVAAVVALIIFEVWYPFPYSQLSAGAELFILIVSVDVICGPLITLTIFNPKKSRRALVFDLTCIGLVQLAALSYGVWTMSIARPVHMVFEQGIFRIVHANDLSDEYVRRTPAGITAKPLTGPTFLAVNMPTDTKEKNAVLDAALLGNFEAMQCHLWVPYENKQGEAIAARHPLSALLAEATPEQKNAIEKIVADSGADKTKLGFLPVIGRNYLEWSVIMDDQGTIIDYVPVAGDFVLK